MPRKDEGGYEFPHALRLSCLYRLVCISQTLRDRHATWYVLIDGYHHGLYHSYYYSDLVMAGMTWVVSVNEMDGSFPDIAACASMIFALCISNKYNIYVSIAISTVAKSIAADINEGMPLTALGAKTSWLYDFGNADVGGFPVIFIITVFIYWDCISFKRRQNSGNTSMPSAKTARA